MQSKKSRLPEGIDLHMRSISESPAQNQITPLHTHTFFELVFVLRGKAYHNLNGSLSMVQAGDYFIVDYGTAHGYIPYLNTEFCYMNCLFYADFIDKALKNCTNFTDVVNSYMLKYNYSIVNLNPADYIFRDANQQIRSIMESMHSEFQAKQAGYKAILRAKLIEILILTMRKNNAYAQDTESSLCARMKEYAAENLAHKNMLALLSRDLNYSVSYLSRHFKKHTGISFSVYLQKLRIEQSLRLLAATNKKINEIAELCGYNDVKFFYALFKKQTGVTPGEFRKQLF